MMAEMSGSSAHKIGLAALTLVTASNMMGSGVFMLPTIYFSCLKSICYSWIITILHYCITIQPTHRAHLGTDQSLR